MGTLWVLSLATYAVLWLFQVDCSLSLARLGVGHGWCIADPKLDPYRVIGSVVVWGGFGILALLAFGWVAKVKGWR